ncbi:MAG: ATP synthase F1 subunit gamma, partial [Vicinamibacterales bacterium]
VLNSVAGRVDAAAHPLLDERKTPRANGRALLFVITADRGLCGSFNANVIKAAANFITEHPDRQVGLGLVGRRGRDYYAKRGFAVIFERINLFGKLQFEDAREIAKTAIGAFTAGEVDSVHLVYNEFRSVLAQRVVAEQLLPIPRDTFDTGAAQAGGGTTDYLYEPAPEELFTTLLPTHVEVQVFRALLESNAAFYAAQMTAMDAATRNSGEMIENLTLYMNKVRQAAITREIIEVVSGAQAL